MYIVEITNGAVTTQIHGEKQKLKSGNVVKGINCIDSFSFALLTSNQGFHLIHDFQTLVTVYNTNKNKYEFRGRVLNSTSGMDTNGLITKEVVCESYLGFLCDSRQSYIAEKNWTVLELLQHIINMHNSQVEEYKHFTVGEVTVTDPNDNLYIGIQRENSWKTIEEKLINKLGGEIRFRIVDGVTYLDYLTQIGTTHATEIALSKNMKSIVKETDPTEYITRLIPLGCKLTDADGNETEERLDITTVNDGLNYIENESACKVYGIHVDYAYFDDVTTATALFEKGKAYLSDNNRVKVKYSISALDLSLLGLDIFDFEVHDYYQIKNSLLLIDDTARIVKKNINVCEEIQSTIEVGDSFKTLSDIQTEQNRNFKTLENTIASTKNDLKKYVASVEKGLTQKIEGIDGTYFYIKYSSYDDGHVMTDIPDDNTVYMGICNTNAATAPTDCREYTWAKIRGTDGASGVAGADGKTQYLHIKYSNDGKTFTGNLASTDFDDWKTGWYTDSEIENTDRIYYPEMIPVIAGQKYVLNTGIKGGYGYTYYDIDGNYMTALGSTTHNAAITISENVGFVLLWISEVGSYDEARDLFSSGELLPEFYPEDAVHGEDPGEWIGTLVDFNDADSITFSDYTWKKFTEDVEPELDEIRQAITEQNTSLTNTCEEIILEALKSYTKTGDFDSFKEATEAQLKLLSDQLELKFTKTLQQLETVNGELQEQLNTITKYFTFDVDGLIIGQVDNPKKISVDNDEINILVNDVPVQTFDADGNALIPSLKVTQEFNLFGYLINQDGNGNVNCEYVGG